MEYFDSDVIFNCIVEQEVSKHKEANDLFISSLSRNAFISSTLAIGEVDYGLARFELPASRIRRELEYYQSLNIVSIELICISRAVKLAEIIGFKHINDCILTATAEHLNCEVLHTYNKSDFKRIQRHTAIKINIL